MDKSIQAVCKNTFISFVAKHADDSLPVSMLPRLPMRSKSAESVRSRPETEQFQELSQQSLQRLNVALSIGISSPKLTRGEAKDINDGFSLPQGKVASKVASTPRNDFSELRLLQGRLAKALDNPMSQQKVWDKNFRVSSSCSLSTMAPDDVSECGESLCSGQRRMPKVWSSGSVSSMISDWADCCKEEDEEVEFELDIQEVDGPTMTHENSTDSASTSMSTSTLPKGAHLQMQLEMSHSQVPRNQNMEEMYNCSKDTPVTTMMIRNMPGRYSQNDLMVDLHHLGFAGTYDFLYIPIDKRTAANVGYAFVNFVDDLWAQRCAQCFEGYRFSQQKRSSNKVGSVSVAFLQGLEKNLQHYEHSAVNMSRDKRRKPVVMPSIAQACR